ncbi:hypothetical protein [Arthrobacter silvisoli]|uniref:hypothetical protein n=1 Tax=Arthrobacter silvisoli TaxID=2291022 RepID=UPI00109B9183|nr:hypothetical protein [Arthrobacter silvisoli]
MGFGNTRIDKFEAQLIAVGFSRHEAHCLAEASFLPPDQRSADVPAQLFPDRHHKENARFLKGTIRDLVELGPPFDAPLAANIRFQAAGLVFGRGLATAVPPLSVVTSISKLGEQPAELATLMRVVLSNFNQWSEDAIRDWDWESGAHPSGPDSEGRWGLSEYDDFAFHRSTSLIGGGPDEFQQGSKCVVVSTLGFTAVFELDEVIRSTGEPSTPFVIPHDELQQAIFFLPPAFGDVDKRSGIRYLNWDNNDMLPLVLKTHAEDQIYLGFPLGELDSEFDRSARQFYDRISKNVSWGFQLQSGEDPDFAQFF